MSLVAEALRAMPEARRVSVERNTKETQITLRLDLDGGPIEIDTGVKFFDHMLDALAKHGGLGLVLVARGDGMDNHHLIEDVGIALGRALHDALGEKRGIARFGSTMIPLDDALVAGSVDLSGRAFLNFAVRFTAEDLGDLKTELVPEFFRALVDNGKFNLHLIQMHGHVNHHLCEAAFKACARSLAAAKSLTGTGEILSTKGVLE
jgi:imidazoleglycerol-phosphate dehydratase